MYATINVVRCERFFVTPSGKPYRMCIAIAGSSAKPSARVIAATSCRPLDSDVSARSPRDEGCSAQSPYGDHCDTDVLAVGRSRTEGQSPSGQPDGENGQ